MITQFLSKSLTGKPKSLLSGLRREHLDKNTLLYTEREKHHAREGERDRMVSITLNGSFTACPA